jgi:hypothetical protein
VPIATCSSPVSASSRRSSRRSRRAGAVRCGSRPRRRPVPRRRLAPRRFAEIWPKLRRGYLPRRARATWIGPRRGPSGCLGFVDEVADAQVVRGPSAGLGSDLRLKGPGVLGSGLRSRARRSSSRPTRRSNAWSDAAWTSVRAGRAGSRRARLAPSGARPRARRRALSRSGPVQVAARCGRLRRSLRGVASPPRRCR